jgi:flagellar hook-basal body complex protein FliE
MQSAVTALQALESVDALALTRSPAVSPGAAAPGFVDWVVKQSDILNEQLLQAENGVQRLATGDGGNLHDVMLQLEQARLALQLATQVRARVIEAYQEVMRMQV